MFKKKIFKEYAVCYSNELQRKYFEDYFLSLGYVVSIHKDGDYTIIFPVTKTIKYVSKDEIKRNNYKIIPFKETLKKGYKWNEELGKIEKMNSFTCTYKFEGVIDSVSFKSFDRNLTDKEVKELYEDEKMKEISIDGVTYELKEKKEEFKYPIFVKFLINGDIIRFDSLNSGQVVFGMNDTYEIGYKSDNWSPHINIKVWQILDYDAKRGLYDGQPILFYDKGCCSRILGFYDAKNKSAFLSNGVRNGIGWDNIKPLTTEQIKAFHSELVEMYNNLKLEDK